MHVEKVYNTESIFMAFVFLVSTLCSCSRTDKEIVNSIQGDLEKFDSIRLNIEKNYTSILTDSTRGRPRIVFVDCEKEGNLSIQDYICNDQWVIKHMNALNLVEISFESPRSGCSKILFGQLFFNIRTSSSFQHGISLVYEYCGTSKVFKSPTFEYIPIDSNWSIQIEK